MMAKLDDLLCIVADPRFSDLPLSIIICKSILQAHKAFAVYIYICSDYSKYFIIPKIYSYSSSSDFHLALACC